MDVLEAMKKEMLRRRLSRRTISTYLFYVRKFLLFCPKNPKEFSKKDCREFLMTFMERGFKWQPKSKDDVAGSSMNVALNALKFMMEEVLRKSMKVNIRYSKVPKRQPLCLSRDEIRTLIASIGNEKHRLLVSLMYGAGLRVSEAVNLRVQDLDFEAGNGWVRHGKGDKDRPFIIPECLMQDMQNIITGKQSGDYVFAGRNGHLTARSVQEILKDASRKSGLKPVHPHTLRHSFATHVLESGSDISTVQALLGHGEVRSTMGYLHAVKPKLIRVKSPLDSI